MRTIWIGMFVAGVVGVCADVSAAPEPAPPVETIKERCDRTRTDRRVRLMATLTNKIRIANAIRLHTKTIVKACKIVETPTGAVRFDGSRAYPEMRMHAQCTGALPKGVSKDTALYALLIAKGMQVEPFGQILDDGDSTPDDRACFDLDKDEGFDWLAARYGDRDSVSALIKK